MAQYQTCAPVSLLFGILLSSLVGVAHADYQIAQWQLPPIPTARPLSNKVRNLVLPTSTNPIPLIYGQSLNEQDIQRDLTRGAVLLPIGAHPGEPGNAVIVAHSTGLVSVGPYRFAFTSLAQLQPGDQFMIVGTGLVHTYEVYATDVVWPHQVDRLPHSDESTVTLVTCWPLWTDRQRLLVHARQIDVQNVAATDTAIDITS